MTKRILFGALTLALVLTACTGQPSAAKTPEELTRAYSDAITGSRDQDLNDAMDVITDPNHDLAEFIFPLLGVTAEDMTAYAISVSPRNVQAYAVCAVMPAGGREETVRDGLEGYVELQKQNFERYLPDQYDVASAARVETLEDGTVLLVMCEGQDQVLGDIKKALEGA